MKASHYHDHPIDDLLAKYAAAIPDDLEGDDLICFVDEVEEMYGVEVDFANIEDVDLYALEMSKEARRSTPAEKARARRYRLQNKAKIQRARKQRKRKVRAGAHRVKRRVGNASTGYSFVERPQKQRSSTSFRSPSVSSSSSSHNFNPVQQTQATSMQTRHLKKMAYLTDRMRELEARGHRRSNAFAQAKREWLDKEASAPVRPVPNAQNPIAGQAGFPPPPPKRGQVKVKRPPSQDPPGLKSALTHNSLPSRKVNTKPKFKTGS